MLLLLLQYIAYKVVHCVYQTQRSMLVIAYCLEGTTFVIIIRRSCQPSIRAEYTGFATCYQTGYRLMVIACITCYGHKRMRRYMGSGFITIIHRILQRCFCSGRQIVLYIPCSVLQLLMCHSRSEKYFSAFYYTVVAIVYRVTPFLTVFRTLVTVLTQHHTVAFIVYHINRFATGETFHGHTSQAVVFVIVSKAV